MSAAPFWERKALADMTHKEWESLCDGCGKCCLISLEDEDTGEIHLTDVACKLLDGDTCRCGDYANRKARVPDCLKLTPDAVPGLKWLPGSCAYRRVSEGRGLPDWHPLVTGDPDSAHKAGATVAGKTVSETRVKTKDLIKRIVSF